MSNLALFLKKNKIEKKNTFYAATKSLCDEKGEPLEWEIRPISTRQNDAIREKCTVEVQITGKPGQYRQKINTSKYVAELLAASVVYPDLNDKTLQDSYGVMNPTDLLQEMIDSPTEYNDFAAFVQNFSGFDVDFNDEVKEAKN